MKQVINKIPIVNDFFTVLSAPVESKELRRKYKVKNIDETLTYSYDIYSLLVKLLGENKNPKRSMTPTPSF